MEIIKLGFARKHNGIGIYGEAYGCRAVRPASEARDASLCLMGLAGMGPVFQLQLEAALGKKAVVL